MVSFIYGFLYICLPKVLGNPKVHLVITLMWHKYSKIDMRTQNEMCTEDIEKLNYCTDSQQVLIVMFVLDFAY